MAPLKKATKIGDMLKATHIQKPPSPELWWMWGTFAEPLVNVGEVLVNMVLWVRQSSPNFARLRQNSHEGVRISGTPWNLPDKRSMIHPPPKSVGFEILFVFSSKFIHFLHIWGLFGRGETKILEAKKPTQIPKYLKDTSFTRTFSQSSRELAFFSVTRVRSPTEITQKNLFRWTFFILGGLFRVDYPPVKFSEQIFGTVHRFAGWLRGHGIKDKHVRGSASYQGSVSPLLWRNQDLGRAGRIRGWSLLSSWTVKALRKRPPYHGAIKRRQKLRTQAVTWVVAKLQGDEIRNSLMGSFGKRSLRSKFRKFLRISANFPQNRFTGAIKRISLQIFVPTVPQKFVMTNIFGFLTFMREITSAESLVHKDMPKPIRQISPIAWRRRNLDVSFMAPALIHNNFLFPVEPSMAESDWPHRLQCATKPQDNCQEEPQQGENGAMEKRMEKSAWHFAHVC